MNAINHKFGKVGVLFGGRSAEREVSIMSGNGVVQALKNNGIDAHLFDTGECTLAELAEEKFDRVFIALHGRFGEDGSMQGALEQLGIPYTGSGVMASAIAMDKIMSKRVLQSVGLPTPKFLVLDATTATREELRLVPDVLGLPLMLKAPHEGSSIGISKVVGYSDMQDGFSLCTKYDETILAEEFISGRELTVPVMGFGSSAHALPIIEIRAPEGKYDYQNKYFTDDTKYVCPALLDEVDGELTQKIQSLAVQAYNALGCRGWARVDFMLRETAGKEAEPFLIEINTSPGMTGHSLVPMSAKAAGHSYEEICVKILSAATLDLQPSKNWKPD